MSTCLAGFCCLLHLSLSKPHSPANNCGDEKEVKGLPCCQQVGSVALTDCLCSFGIAVLVFILQCWCSYSLVTNPPSAIVSIFQSLGLNDRIYLSFSNIVLGSKPVIVVLDEENVDEDGGVDEQREGDNKEKGPLNSISHFCSMLLVLKANLMTYCMVGMKLKVITSLLCEFISFFG